MESDDAAFDELIEKSSLGTPGARRLRARTSKSHAAVVRQIIKLRNVMAHGSRDEIVGAANTLLQLFGDLGYDAQVQRVLAEAFPGQEAETVLTMARLIADSRQASQQKTQPANDGRGSATRVAGTVPAEIPTEQQRRIEDQQREIEELTAELTRIQEQQGHDALTGLPDLVHTNVTPIADAEVNEHLLQRAGHTGQAAGPWALTDQVRSLSGDMVLHIVELAEAGIVIWEVRRDTCGSPRARHWDRCPGPTCQTRVSCPGLRSPAPFTASTRPASCSPAPMRTARCSVRPPRQPWP